MTRTNNVQEITEGTPDKKSGDPCEDTETHIQESKKQPSRRFPSVDPEDALKWMNDFPLRKEKFVASLREGKNRDLSA